MRLWHVFISVSREYATLEVTYLTQVLLGLMFSSPTIRKTLHAVAHVGNINVSLLLLDDWRSLELIMIRE